MFKLTKQDHVITAIEIKEGTAFRFEGEIYVRIKTPTNPQFDAQKIYGISLETWRLLAIDPTAVVEMFIVEAVAKPLPHDIAQH